MATFRRVFESAQGETIHAKGKRFNFLTGDGEIVVHINGTKNNLSPGQGLVFLDYFQEIYIESTVNQSAVIFVGDEIFTDARLVGAVSVSQLSSSTFADGWNAEVMADTDVFDVGGSLLPSTREIFIRSSRNSTGVVWTGGAVDVGLPIYPGESLIVSRFVGAFVLYSDGANTVHVMAVSE